MTREDKRATLWIMADRVLAGLDGRAVMADELAKRNALVVRKDDLVKRVAMDIGKDTADYIERMYPKAVEAESSTFLLSVRNHVYNEIMGAIESEMDGEKRCAGFSFVRRRGVEIRRTR